MRQCLICFVVIVFLLSLIGLFPVSAEEESSFELYCRSQYGSMDVCRKEQAIKRDDPSFCRNIETTATRNSCYTYFAKHRHDASFCGPVRAERNSYKSVFTCLEPFLTSLSNVTICDSSFGRDEETQDLCYERLADVSENASLCPKLYHPKKKIKCYTSAAKVTFDLRYCDAMKQEIDTSVCEDLEIESCDTTTHLNEVIDTCKYEATLNQRRVRCNSYDNEKEAEFGVGQGSQFVFKHDDPTTETFTVNVPAIDITLGVATVELEAARHKVPYNVRVGNVMTHEFVNMYVVNIWQEEQEEPAEEGQPVPEPIRKVELCFFREPKAERGREEPQQEEPEEESAEEPTTPGNITVEEPLEQPAEEQSQEESEEEAAEENEETEENMEKEEILPEEGFLRRTIRWFLGLFGIG